MEEPASEEKLVLDKISLGDAHAVNSTEIKKAVKLLAEAEWPVAMADIRTMWNHAHPELEEFVNRLCVPLVSATRAIRPIIPETNPLNLGLYETRAAPPALQVMEKADVLLAIDCYFDSFLATGEIIPQGFSKKDRFPERIIQIDSDPSLLAKNYPVEIAIAGNSKTILKVMLSELEKIRINRDRMKTRLAKIRKMKNEWESFINREYQKLRTKTPISPLVLARELNRTLPKDSIVSVSGAFNSVVFHTLGTFTCEVPGSILGIGTDGSLGTGLCKAIGAKLAAQDRPVIAYLGDGEFWYGNLSELETLSRTNLSVVTVISNNGCFGSDKYRQLKMFGGRLIGVDFSNPNFAELAKVFGLNGERVEEAHDIRPAVERALSSGKPSIVDVVTGLEAPPTFPRGISPV